MSKKKVLVIGGTGIAGQFITDYLLHYHDICELFIASRGIHKISEKKVKFIKMAIHDTQNIESVIKQFDIIILALGPFSCVGTDIYTICLRNHVICVDINDDYGHSGRVLEIKNENRNGIMSRVDNFHARICCRTIKKNCFRSRIENLFWSRCCFWNSFNNQYV